MSPAYRNYASSVLLVILCCAARAQTPASAVIDDCQYADDATAQRKWLPMSGTPPVKLSTANGAKALHFPCNFAGTTIERASWDYKCNLDLSASRGLEFDLLCTNSSSVSYFSIYLESGAGWYHAPFFPETDKDWNTVRIDKAAAGIEGKPAGWGQIRTIRFSAWRARDVSTDIWIKNIRQTGLLGAQAAVAILRADSLAQRSPGEVRSVNQFSEAMAEYFDALNVPCSVFSDLDAKPALLGKAKLVVLPYNPSMPEAVVDHLVQYMRSDGKLMAFYSVPDKLRPLLHLDNLKHVKAPFYGAFSTIRFASNSIAGAPSVVSQSSWNINDARPTPGSRVIAEWFDNQDRTSGPAIIASSNTIYMTHVLLSDDLPRKRKMLLAMAGHLVPDIWQQATSASLQSIGALSSFKSFDDAVSQIPNVAKGDPRVTQAIAKAKELRASAVSLSTAGSYPQAIEQASHARDAVEQAFCMAQQPLPGEFRAFWCHSAFGVNGISWDEAIRRLAENGFTAILPNMLWGGVAYYPSDVLPTATEVKERGDQIAQCLAACRKYGVQIHVWKVNWNLGHATPKEFAERMQREGRTQVSSRGKQEPWLCPSHPQNQKLEIDSMVELVRKYDLDGIHFDYIRYPDSDHCFCNGCKERFGRAAGVTITNWPADLLKDGPLRESWREWRRANINRVVKAVSEQARALKPKTKISAAVFRNWTSDRNSVGQDWKVWCDQGYMDFVCPMDYTESNRSFENMVSQQVQWTGKVPCYPGIGVSASSSRFGPDRVIEQILITRRHQTGGFTIFNYGVPESRDLLPLLGLGITRK